MATSSARPQRPFLSISPGSVSPIVLTCEHATHKLPPPLRATGEEREVLSSHWGWDIGGWSLTRDLARRLRSGAVGGRWSRLLIDLNRRVTDPTLIRSKAGRIPLSWNHGIGVDEVERRILDYHAPYHTEVDRLTMRRLVRGISPLLLAVHTFTPVYHGRRRPFQIGILYERDGTLAHRLGRDLRDAGLSVRYNQPYSGMAGMMYSIDRHGKHHRLPCLEIEVNHEMLLSAKSVTTVGGVTARALGRLLAALPGV